MATVIPRPRFSPKGSSPALAPDCVLAGRERGCLRQPKLGRGMILYAGLLLGLAGCETVPDTTRTLAAQSALPSLQGSYHVVRPGETLWRIARSYGFDVNTLAEANRLPDATQLSAGQRLFIPLPPESRQFLWPVQGTFRKSGSSGLEISAPAGSLIRASRSGRVAVAARRLSGWGKTVILQHPDGYLTVYAGLSEVLVAPRAEIRQGRPIGSLGPRALHFEIRYGSIPKDPLALLPN